MKVTKRIVNFSKYNFVGQLVEDWGNKPGRIVSISYVLEDGYVAVENRRDPHQFTTDFFKGGKCVSGEFRVTAGADMKVVDWGKKKDAPRTYRCIDGLSKKFKKSSK